MVLSESIMSQRPGYRKQAPLSRAQHVTWQSGIRTRPLDVLRRRMRTHQTLVGVKRARESNIRTNELLMDTLLQFSQPQENDPTSPDLDPGFPPPKEETFEESFLRETPVHDPPSPSTSVLAPAERPPRSQDLVSPSPSARAMAQSRLRSPTKAMLQRVRTPSEEKKRAVLRRDLHLQVALKAYNGGAALLTREEITWCERPNAVSENPSELEVLFREWLPLRKVGTRRDGHIRDRYNVGVSDLDFYERIRQGWQLHINSRTVYLPGYEDPRLSDSLASLSTSSVQDPNWTLDSDVGAKQSLF